MARAGVLACIPLAHGAYQFTYYGDDGMHYEQWEQEIGNTLSDGALLAMMIMSAAQASAESCTELYRALLQYLSPLHSAAARRSLANNDGLGLVRWLRARYNHLEPFGSLPRSFEPSDWTEAEMICLNRLLMPERLTAVSYRRIRLLPIAPRVQSCQTGL